MSTALIVDGNNLAMRAIFAMHKSGLSAGGVRTGPLVVFINGLVKLVAEERPSALLVCWDGDTSKRRVALYPGYKSNRTAITERDAEFRTSTFGLIKQFCALANVPQLQLPGIEADDLVAAAWSTLDPGYVDKIVIGSSDKDFLQLLGDNPHGVRTEQIRFSSAEVETDRWTEERLIGELGYTPAQVPLVMALTGDAGDGVPGVPGIGPKRAVKLLEASAWDLEATAKEVARTKPIEAERIPLAHALVDLRTPGFPVAVPRWNPTGPADLAWEEMDRFLTTYELRQIGDKLRSGALWRPFTASNGLPGRPLGKRSGG